MRKLLFFLLLSSFGFSQNPRLDQMYLNNSVMGQPSIANYQDDIFIASTISTDSNNEINIFRRNQMGTVLWSKNYYFDQNLFIGSIKVDNSYNELIITGYSEIFDVKKLFVMVMDLEGNILKKKVFEDDLMPNMSLYGTDLIAMKEEGWLNPCERNGNYMITGFGSANSSHNSNKFAFVASISDDLSSVNWYKKYDSGATTSNGYDFDSFNSIKKITRKGENLFLLVGSGVDNTTGASTATIDLIDSNGDNVVWGNGKRVYKILGAYTPNLNDTFGKYAIYNRYTDEIYLIGSVYQDTENGLGVIRIDASTGIPQGNFYIHHHNHIPTGVEWYSEIEDKILISSFSVGESHQIPNCGQSSSTQVFSVLDFNNIDLNYKTFAFDHFYSDVYLSSAINVDFLINPINYNGLSYYNQPYYSPKGLVKTNFFFESVGMNENISPFGVNNYVLHPINLTNNNCDLYCEDDTQIISNIQHNNFIGFFSKLNSYNQQVSNKNIITYKKSYCNPARPNNSHKYESKKSINLNIANKFLVYPNPSENYVTIQGKLLNDNEEYEINIIDIKGKLLMISELNQKPTKIDISSLASGLYIISIKSSNNKTVLTEKLIKN